MKQLKAKPDKTQQQMMDKWTPHLRRSCPVDLLASWKAPTVEGEDPEVKIVGRKSLSNVNYVFDLWESVARKFPNVSLFILTGKKPSRLRGYGLLDIALEPLALRFQNPGEGIETLPEPEKFEGVFETLAERMSKEERRIQFGRLDDRLHLATLEWELYEKFHHDVAQGHADKAAVSLHFVNREAFETEQKHIEAMLAIYERIDHEHEG